MDPFFGNRSWYQQPHPRYAYSHSHSYPTFPVHRVDPWETCLPFHPSTRPTQGTPPAQKVVRIPVQFVGSKKVDPSGSALKIQKVFRGFLVRKCMGKIKDIKFKVDEIGERLSNENVVELIRKDDKERLRMNETLMSLLIQLDSISGLDFGVRQCRKAVIRRAISLQEKIDAIVAAEIPGDTRLAEGETATRIEGEAEGVDVGGEGEVKEGGQTAMRIEGESEVVEGEVKEEGETAKRMIEGESEVVDGEVKEEGEPNIDVVNSDTGEKVKNKDEEDNKRNGELLERMMEENEKMMKMMRQVIEKNEGQTRMLNMLTQRVEALEKAFACEKQRKKKKKKNSPPPPPPRRED